MVFCFHCNTTGAAQGDFRRFKLGSQLHAASWSDDSRTSVQYICPRVEESPRTITWKQSERTPGSRAKNVHCDHFHDHPSCLNERTSTILHSTWQQSCGIIFPCKCPLLRIMDGRYVKPSRLSRYFSNSMDKRLTFKESVIHSLTRTYRPPTVDIRTLALKVATPDIHIRLWTWLRTTICDVEKATRKSIRSYLDAQWLDADFPFDDDCDGQTSDSGQSAVEEPEPHLSIEMEQHPTLDESHIGQFDNGQSDVGQSVAMDLDDIGQNHYAQQSMDTITVPVTPSSQPLPASFPLQSAHSPLVRGRSFPVQNETLNKIMDIARAMSICNGQSSKRSIYNERNEQVDSSNAKYDAINPALVDYIKKQVTAFAKVNHVELKSRTDLSQWPMPVQHEFVGFLAGLGVSRRRISTWLGVLKEKCFVDHSDVDLSKIPKVLANSDTTKNGVLQFIKGNGPGHHGQACLKMKFETVLSHFTS